MFHYNPFEQFEISLLKGFMVANYDLSITSLTFGLLLGTILTISSLIILDLSYDYIPNNWQIVKEGEYNFILTIVEEQAGNKGIGYFPHLITVFLIILLFNITGLIPFGSTASAQVILTFYLALSYFIAWIIIAVKELGPKFLYVFCPKNMPLWLLPLLICVELLSFLLRPISLGVRLFANMLAGHILVHILAGACVYLYSKFILASIPAFMIIGAVGVLEIGIALLQSYIFVILLTIYLKDSLYAH